MFGLHKCVRLSRQTLWHANAPANGPSSVAVQSEDHSVQRSTAGCDIPYSTGTSIVSSVRVKGCSTHLHSRLRSCMYSRPRTTDAV